jgi:predicted AlkP superfamily pyrophosphatase or phosphodiesterase
MHRKLPALLVALTLVFYTLIFPTPGWTQVPLSVHPRLILCVVIDQFSYDFLTRFGDRFGPSGFRFIEQQGAFFTNCRYKQATTVTAIGHAVISTGAYPWATGIIGNDWYDRHRGGEVTAVTDDTTQLVGGNGPGASCRALNGTTFGDQLKLATNGRSKVIALSLKDRAAIMLAGKLANGAYWWDTRAGVFVSSSQFGSTLPNWIRAFNEQHYADRFFGKVWQRLLPENAYAASARDDYAYEGSLPGDGRQFPHVLTGGVGSPSQPFYEAFSVSPFANDMLADLARTAIEQEALGMHTDPDVLFLSFSSTDKCSHLFGTQSQETEDMMLRLDQTLAGLFQYIDRKIGLNNCVVAITGDHGATPLPEYVKERGQLIDAGRIDPGNFKNVLNSALSARLGQGDWISSFTPPNLYLNLAEIDRQKYRQPEVEALAAKLAHAIPGVSEAYTAAQFYGNQLPNGPYTEAVRRSWYWGRSGELYILTKPGYIWSGRSTGSSHGSVYAYDQQVPLMLMGAGIRAGKCHADASPADIAPTMCALLNIQMPPLAEGRVLNEALEQVNGPPAPMQQQQLSQLFRRTLQLAGTGSAR